MVLTLTMATTNTHTSTAGWNTHTTRNTTNKLTVQFPATTIKVKTFPIMATPLATVLIHSGARWCLVTMAMEANSIPTNGGRRTNAYVHRTVVTNCWWNKHCYIKQIFVFIFFCVFKTNVPYEWLFIRTVIQVHW